MIASLPSLGLLTLAGMTPDSIELSYHEVPDPEALDGDLPDEFAEFDAVAISSFTAMIKDAYSLATRFRTRGVPVILGGLHVSLMPDEAEQHADAIVIGEAENVWPQVLDDLLSGTLKPRYDGRDRVFNLARSPMPRFDLLEIDRYNRLTVQTQRGCPYDCEFCASSIRLQPRFRTKPVDRVLAEIEFIKSLWPHPFIEFADDNTFADKRHGRALAEAMAGTEVRWFTESDISVADDAELLALLARSGCAQILIGLESPQPGPLSGIETKGDWKHRQADRYAEAVARIQDAGITVNGCFVLGLDGTDERAFDAVHEFVDHTGLYEVQITLMTPFPRHPTLRPPPRRWPHSPTRSLGTLHPLRCQFPTQPHERGDPRIRIPRAGRPHLQHRLHRSTPPLLPQTPQRNPAAVKRGKATRGIQEVAAWL